MRPDRSGQRGIGGDGEILDPTAQVELAQAPGAGGGEYPPAHHLGTDGAFHRDMADGGKAGGVSEDRSRVADQRGGGAVQTRVTDRAWQPKNKRRQARTLRGESGRQDEPGRQEWGTPDARQLSYLIRMTFRRATADVAMGLPVELVSCTVNPCALGS